MTRNDISGGHNAKRLTECKHEKPSATDTSDSQYSKPGRPAAFLLISAEPGAVRLHGVVVARHAIFDIRHEPLVFLEVRGKVEGVELELLGHACEVVGEAFLDFAVVLHEVGGILGVSGLL